MFMGSESTTVEASGSEDQVYAKIQEGLRDLGSVRVSKSGTITVDPSPNMSSFHSTTTVSGVVTKESDGEYLVKINYDVNPTPVSWIISAVLFFFTCIGGLFFLTSLMQQGQVKTLVQSAFSTLRAKLK